MGRGSWIGSSLLLLSVLGAAAALAGWKRASLQASAAESAHAPEPMESVTVAAAGTREFARTTTSIGTVVALRSIALRNEIAGSVSEAHLEAGSIVEPDTLLVALDVSVEEAELNAQLAQAALAESMLGRMQRASQGHGASEMDVDRARAERDVTLAQVARTRAVIARKTIRAPFRAHVGLSDVHKGQYLAEGTLLTTLQGVDDAVYVDFTVAQAVAAVMTPGLGVDVFVLRDTTPIPAKVVAVDARVDSNTRNAMVRARIEGAEHLSAAASRPAPTPGASVRVRVPTAAPKRVVVVPVSALRKGPAGDHVFVVATDADGKSRAHVRAVRSGPMLGDEVVIDDGVAVGDQVAASGSFKLRDGLLVVIVPDAPAAGSR